MYGPAGTESSTSKAQAQTNTESSTIKIAVDEWYEKNLVDTGYSQYVSDEIFCNDRSTPGKSSTGWHGDSGLGYGKNATAYLGYKKFNGSIISDFSFKCSQQNDAFTVNDTEKGNGALTYPVGLITADEIVAAGSGPIGNANTSFYLYKYGGSSYYSLSPHIFNSYAFIFHVSGSLSSSSVDTAGGVAPVINLSAEYAENMVGVGTIDSPYEFKL